LGYDAISLTVDLRQDEIRLSRRRYWLRESEQNLAGYRTQAAMDIKRALSFREVLALALRILRVFSLRKVTSWEN